jgi:hypothetical protein
MHPADTQTQPMRILCSLCFACIICDTFCQRLDSCLDLKSLLAVTQDIAHAAEQCSASCPAANEPATSEADPGKRGIICMHVVFFVSSHLLAAYYFIAIFRTILLQFSACSHHLICFHLSLYRYLWCNRLAPLFFFR